MADLRTLLHEAAPVPVRPLDMADIRRRARRRRGIVAWLTGLGMVVTFGVPVAGPVLAPGDRGGDGGGGSRVEAAEGTTTTTLVGRPVPAVVDRTGPGAARAERPSTSRRPAAAVPGGRGPLALEVAPASTTGAGPAAYPQAGSCTVDNVGLAARGERRCRFTATGVGGASLVTDGPVSPPPGIHAEVTVTRNGVPTTYYVHDDVVRAGEVATVYCTAGMIQPGDLVDVLLINADVPDGFATTLGAGAGWECWNARGQSGREPGP